ncbi:MAG: crossover junction endodeoxyribonuclease RuvC [Burkholderiales bacterium]|nr:crossover junction endodeoxyribonuclease RuvC [Burkholderiales bacterium]
MRILGIDPGLRKTGFGMIEIVSNQPLYIVSGVIATESKDSLPNRLKTILNGINEIITEYSPQIASVEKVFVNVNPQSTLLLGQARGVAIASCVLNNLEVSEYTALQIKKSVAGYGHAEKTQIAKMVKYLLNLNGMPQADAADALAVSLTHAHYAKLSSIFKMNIARGGRFKA